jgi:hypothetical protein
MKDWWHTVIEVLLFAGGGILIYWCFFSDIHKKLNEILERLD